MIFMYSIAVMGDIDSIGGFKALGLSIHPAENKEQAHEIFKSLLKQEVSVIYITEAVAKFLEEEIQKASQKTLPVVVLIPGLSGNTGEGALMVKSFMQQAVGSDILFEKGD